MRRPVVLAAALLVSALSAWVAAPSLHYDFVYDDEAVVLERKPFWEVGASDFLHSRPYGTGRHLMAVSIDLDRLEAGISSPVAFHRTNIAISSLLSLLVLLLSLRLGLSPLAATAGAALFAVHPLHVDSVAWITGRSELLAALGVVAAVLVAIRPTQHDEDRRPLRVALLVALFAALALHSKENALCLPLLLVAARVLLGRRVALVPALAGFALALASWAVLVVPLIPTFPKPQLVDNPLVYAPAIERIPKALAVLWRYAALLVWPHPLLPDRGWMETDPSLAGGWLAAAAWIVAAAALWRLRHKAPRAVFAAAWFPISFAVTGNLASAIGVLMSERLLLLPSVAFALLVALLVDGARTPALRRSALIAVAAAAAVFFALFREREQVWKDSDTYFSAEVAAAPRSAKAQYDYGSWMLRRERPDDAEAAFRRALAIVPSLSRAANMLAESMAKRGDAAGGAEVYLAYLKTTPDDAAAVKNLARLLLQAGRGQEAVEWAQRYVALAPDSQDALDSLVIVEQAAKRMLPPATPPVSP